MRTDTACLKLLVERFAECGHCKKYFSDLVEIDDHAVQLFFKFAAAINLDEQTLRDCVVTAKGQAMPSYLASIAAFGTAAEAAAALALNGGSFGSAMRRMAAALAKEPFNLSDDELEFMHLFSAEADEFVKSSAAVMDEGLQKGQSFALMEQAALLLQGCYIMFWEAVGGDDRA